MLRCVECGRRTEGLGFGGGWRAYPTLEPDGSESVAVFCPECAQREFGEDTRFQAAFPHFPQDTASGSV